MPYASGYIIPSGGVVVLSVSGIAQGGLLTYSRSFGSGAYSLIASGYPTSSMDTFVDYGEGLQGPLPSNMGAYNYMIQDVSGTAYVTGLTPYTSLSVTPDYATVLVERCLEAGIDGITLPPGFQRPTVTHEMPKAGFQKLPFVLVNQVTMQQTRTQIGQDFPSTQLFGTKQSQTLAVIARRSWRVEIFTRTVTERDFYRDAVLAIFTSMLGSVFQALQLDTSHSFMVHQDQRADKDMDPGFYFADILFNVEGSYNVNLTPEYSGVMEIPVSVGGASGTFFDYTIPVE